MKLYYFKIALILMILVKLCGCSALPVNAGKLEGDVWGNQRYLPEVAEYKKPSAEGWENTQRKLDLSKRAYMYSVAAVLALQKNNTDTRFHFAQPGRLEEVKELECDLESGFQASTYILRKGIGNDEDQVVVAFAGSNEWKDYFLHNFSLNPIQYADARQYLHDVSKNPQLKGMKIVVTGFSLGGGLAVHVTKNSETSTLVHQAWIFNPTPRAGVDDGIDGRIYLLSTSYEVLKKFNREGLGAPKEQTLENYNLIRSSSIYSHYRWVLARQILWYADMALYFDSEKTASTTEPLDIIRTQKIDIGK
ncbi:Mbeg1-like protein [Janthinobacterium sp. RA13]|uniref:Mbeg1-like protein n=1 Tax=Janthinobacterium sp. RA13 TaxID=1502762 RepID=UPI0012699C68|nr:Mbeg1-like protein [Janthinobacterium sp. RA13]